MWNNVIIGDQVSESISLENIVLFLQFIVKIFRLNNK